MLRPALPGLDGDLDELFQRAVEEVIQYDRASPSLLQRRLSIGYARAARLMDQLEHAGVVTVAEGSRPRVVLIRSVEEILGQEQKQSSSSKDDVFESPPNYKVPTSIKLTTTDKPAWSPQLADVIDKKEMWNTKYPIPLGVEEKDKLHVQSLAELGNLIIVGNPPSRKEIFIDTCLLSLLRQHAPDELRFVLCDPTRKLNLYDQIPHLLSPVINDYDRVISALRWAQAELDRRLQYFSQAGVRDLDSYNEVSKDKLVAGNIPRILIVNFVSWMDVETTASMTILSSNGQRAGVHLFIVADRTGDKNLSSELKANIPNRAVFTVTSTQESRLAGVDGAEELKMGEMIYRRGYSEAKKLSTIYTSEINIKETVEAVRNSTTSQ